MYKMQKSLPLQLYQLKKETYFLIASSMTSFLLKELVGDFFFGEILYKYNSAYKVFYLLTISTKNVFAIAFDTVAQQTNRNNRNISNHPHPYRICLYAAKFRSKHKICNDS